MTSLLVHGVVGPVLEYSQAMNVLCPKDVVRCEGPYSVQLVKDRIMRLVYLVPAVDVTHNQEVVQSGGYEFDLVRGRVCPEQGGLVDIVAVGFAPAGVILGYQEGVKVLLCRHHWVQAVVDAEEGSLAFTMERPLEMRNQKNK